jgi:hypothetical protein
MAGLNFQTQTIINSNLDPDSGNAGKEVKLFAVAENALRIKRDFVFAKDDARGKVMAIRKAEGYEAEPCIATIDFDAIVEAVGNEEKKYCRLDIYLGVEGAEPFIYATPWVQKGMPFWVEFTIKKGAEGKDVAAEVAKVLAKNHIFLVDKDLLHVSVKGAVMTLTGATEYQRFRNVEVRTFAVTDDYAELVAELGEEGKIELANRGKNAFGTYSQIVKDLRLPTAANYQWTHIRQVETPIVGAIYNQYIVEYCAPSTNEGLGAVGAKLESHTTHVFWVKRDSAKEEGQLCKDFEAMFETIGLSIEGKKASASEEPEEDSELNA